MEVNKKSKTAPVKVEGKKATAPAKVEGKKATPPAKVEVKKAKKTSLSILRGYARKRAEKVRLARKAAKKARGVTKGTGDISLKKPIKRKPMLLAGKYRPRYAIRVSKQIFIGNLPATATEKDIRELLRRFAHCIASIRVLRSTGGGKKATRDKDGKVVAKSRGVAFIRLRTVDARRRVMRSSKNLVLHGTKLRVEKALEKKAHVTMLAKHKTIKEDKAAEKVIANKAVSAEMQKNMVKNEKRAKKLKKALKKQKKAAKSADKSVTKEVKKVVAKKNVIKKQVTRRRSERRKLSGAKAKKAMARMTRH